MTSYRSFGSVYVHDIEAGNIRRSERIAKKRSQNQKKFLRESACECDVYEKYEPKVLTLFNHIIKRELYGLDERPIKHLVAKHLSRNMPSILREHELDLGTVNKVFASQWINDKQVVMGTKCNKILIRDIFTDATLHIPSLKGTGRYEPAECPCGIHAIAVNPSKTLLATGADSTNELAVYKLPSFDPIHLGEGGHTDWIFDIKWIDDEFCISGSRDSRLALWHVRDERNDDRQHLYQLAAPTSAVPVYNHSVGQPKIIKYCPSAEKIRALAYNEHNAELGVLSLNNKLHTWDLPTFTQKKSEKLPMTRENVCMTFDPQRQVYAVGSQSYVILMDSRTLKPSLSIESIQKGYGIRSVSFNENIVTIGTGLGSMLFYDLTAGKYLQCECGQTCILRTAHGYLLRDMAWQDFLGEQYANAIYTHCYDESGTRLFTAGGPLPAALVGNYAGVWQ